MSSICTNVVKLWIIFPQYDQETCCKYLQIICIRHLRTCSDIEARGDKDALPVRVLEQKYQRGACEGRSCAQSNFGSIRSYDLTASRAPALATYSSANPHFRSRRRRSRRGDSGSHKNAGYQRFRSANRQFSSAQLWASGASHHTRTVAIGHGRGSC